VGFCLKFGKGAYKYSILSINDATCFAREFGSDGKKDGIIYSKSNDVLKIGSILTGGAS
jgi:hypothetical protein